VPCVRNSSLPERDTSVKIVDMPVTRNVTPRWSPSVSPKPLPMA
jgi:hypothetical protein